MSCRSALTRLASFFLVWELTTDIDDGPLLHLRNVSDVIDTRTTLFDSIWFLAYRVASLPAEPIGARLGDPRAAWRARQAGQRPGRIVTQPVLAVVNACAQLPPACAERPPRVDRPAMS